MVSSLADAKTPVITRQFCGVKGQGREHEHKGNNREA